MSRQIASLERVAGTELLELRRLLLARLPQSPSEPVVRLAAALRAAAFGSGAVPNP
ncbi:hypothetical protein P3T35_005704 [Kitasatospora sp. GP30]|nr:hypothetical protein [Kitasatospora sp. GP30]